MHQCSRSREGCRDYGLLPAQSQSKYRPRRQQGQHQRPELLGKRCPRHLKAVSLRQRSARLPGGVGRNEHPRMAVEPQREMGTADGARRGDAPLNGVWGVRRWPRVSSICCTILRNGSTVDAELYSGKKVMPLSTLLVMGIYQNRNGALEEDISR